MTQSLKPTIKFEAFKRLIENGSDIEEILEIIYDLGKRDGEQPQNVPNGTFTPLIPEETASEYPPSPYYYPAPWDETP